MRGIGWEGLHVAVDHATRLAYAEVLDEGEIPEAEFLKRAVAWLAARGVRVRRVMTDNGPGYRSCDHARVCRQLRLKHLRTRPYQLRPAAPRSTAAALYRRGCTTTTATGPTAPSVERHPGNGCIS